MLTNRRSILEFLCKRWRVLAVLCCLPLAAAAQQQLASADASSGQDELAREASFHIESGPLKAALLEFSRQAGIQVIFQEKVADVSVTAIDGHRNAREVLTALLNASGLKFAVVGKTVTVYAEPKKRSAPIAPRGGEPATPTNDPPAARRPKPDGGS